MKRLIHSQLGPLLSCLLSFVFLLLVAMFMADRAWSWGKIGHRVVGEIAEQNLLPATQKRLRQLFPDDRLPKLSTWADEIRSEKKWDHAAPWHYVNIEDGKSYSTIKKNDQGDIVWAILHFTSVLKDQETSEEQKREAIKFLAHFVGDIHQPLHVGKPQDRGGNDYEVKWFNHKTNLHQVWDEALIQHEELSYTEFVAHLPKAKPEEIKKWQNSSVHDWAQESLALREACYPKKGDKLKYEYQHEHIPTINERLLQAGYRLAHLLNENFRLPPKKSKGQKTSKERHP